MAETPEEDAREPIEGQVITGEGTGKEKGEKSPVPVRPQTRAGKTLQRLLSFVSRFPFRNRTYLRAIKSATGVVEAQTNLKEAYIKHQETKGRLQDVGVITGKQRAQRIQEWTEGMRGMMKAKLELDLWEKDEEILTMKKETELEQERLKKEYAVKKTELEYRKTIAELDKEVEMAEGASSKKKSVPSTTGLFREKEKIDKEVAKRKEKIQSSNKPPEEKKSDMKLVERWREEMYERVEAQYRREMGDDGPGEK